MSTYRNFIETNEGIVVYLDDKIRHVLVDNPLFAAVKEKIEAFDFASIPDLIDIASRIKKYSDGRFWVNEDGVIVIDGEDIPEPLSQRILAFTDQGWSTEPLELFWDRNRENESEDARQDLFGFLEHLDISFTKEGNFIAYKRVKRIEDALRERGLDSIEDAQVLVCRVDADTSEDVMVWVDAQPGDLVDIRTGTIRNNPGDTPFMAREDVANDRERCCAPGLHVAAYAYADHKYYSNGDLLEVIVDPRDVVSVPVTYDGEKMRVSKYTVSRIAGEPRTEPLAFTVGSELNYTSPDDGETEAVEVVTAHGGHPNRYDVRFKDGTVLTGVAEKDLAWKAFQDREDLDDEDDDDYDEDYCRDCGEHYDNCECDDEDDDDEGARLADLDDEPEEDAQTKGLRKLIKDADSLSEDAKKLLGDDE